MRKQKLRNLRESATDHNPTRNTGGTQAQLGYFLVSKAILKLPILLPPSHRLTHSELARGLHVAHAKPEAGGGTGTNRSRVSVSSDAIRHWREVRALNPPTPAPSGTKVHLQDTIAAKSLT